MVSCSGQVKRKLGRGVMVVIGVGLKMGSPVSAEFSLHSFLEQNSCDDLEVLRWAFGGV